MRHFYQESPQKIDSVLSELVDNDLYVGLSFEQQVKSSDSVPDALISQAPLDIYFETKRGGELDRRQIKKHITSIARNGSDRTRKILIGITKTPIIESVKEEIIDRAKKKKIIFVSVTFAELVRALREQCLPHETNLCDIVSDYEDYLTGEDLMQIGDVVTVVTCGISIHENVRYMLYFNPADKGIRVRSKFIGIYKDKCIQYIAEVKTIVSGVLNGNRFSINNTEKGRATTEQKRRIRGAIAACTYFPDFAREEYLYYLFDEIHPTEIKKVSKGGVWGTRKLNLSDWLEYDDPTKTYSAKEVAELMKGEKFK